MEGDKIKTNILIAGKSGVGKSSLLNYIFGEEVAETGAGKPVTAEGLHEYSFELKDNDRISFSICDSWGLTRQGGRMAQADNRQSSGVRQALYQRMVQHHNLLP